MPHPLHNFKINGKMNDHSLQTLFKKCLNGQIALCLFFLLGLQITSFGQTFSNPSDTIEVIIPANTNKGIVTGQQIHDALNPSDLLFFDNQDTTNDASKRDTTFIPDDNTPILYVSCDTATFTGDMTQRYGIDTKLDTIEDLSQVKFFTYFDGGTPRNMALRNGSTNPVINPVLSGTGTSVTAIFKVIDNTPPMAICRNRPQNDPETVYLDSLGRITAMQLDSASTDNCTKPADLTFSIQPDSIRCDSVNKGAFKVKLFVADEAGNMDSCDTWVVVRDTLGPIFQNVPKDTIIDCDAPIPGQATLMAIDNCSGVDSMWMDTINTRAVFDTTNANPALQTMRPDTMNAFFNYRLTYKWYARDTLNNIDSAQQIITVQDTTAPKIDFPDTLRVSSAADAQTCTATVTIDLTSTVRDACYDTLKYVAIADENMVIQNDTSLTTTITVPMDTVVHIIAADFAGNRDTQALVIVVNDFTVPRPVCINAISLTINPLGYVVARPQDINMNSSDNCTPANMLSFSLNRDTFRCTDIGTTSTVIMTVTDAAGNIASCPSEITIRDFTGTGAFTIPNDTTVLCESDISPENLGFATASDVCGENRISFRDTSSNTTNSGCRTIQRIWTARDTFGNPTNRVQLINLVDTVAPTFMMTFSDTVVNCVADANTMDSLTVTDNCFPTFKVGAKDSVRCASDTIYYQRIWNATDGCNPIVDTQLVKIFDNVAPAITFPNNRDTFTYETGTAIPDSCGVFVTIDFKPFVTDCNSQFGLKIGHSGQDTTAILSRYFEVGNHTVAVTAADSCGNLTTKNLVIDVNDTSIPTVVCDEDVRISLGTGGTGVLRVSDVLIRATDNCGGNLPDSLAFLSQDTFDCTDLGSQMITLSVRDTSGNIGSCTVSLDINSQGNVSILSVEAKAQAESSIAANDGVAWVEVTGGSGNYTYAWTPGGATTDTIRNLSPDVYQVSVNDMGTGCILTDSVEVKAAAPVSYSFGNVTGAAGDTIQVPVIVSNFDSVAGFEMKLTLSNTSVASFVNGNEAGGFNFSGLSSTAFAYQNVGEIDLQSLPSLGTTLADGSTLFFVNVALTGTAGQMSILEIKPLSGANVETTVIVNASATAIASTADSLKITIQAPTANPPFGGKISLSNNTPLEGITVNLTGAATATDMTDAAGDYTFTTMPNQNYTVRPTENRNHNRGLNVTDLAIIQNHILRNALLDSPYKMLAADVNNSQSITISDLVEIQAVVLGQQATFSSVPSWKFIPANIALTLADPWANAPYPDSISMVSENANFIGYKMGDVSLSATSPALQEVTPAKSREVFRFGVQDQSLEAGDLVEVPFLAKDFEALYAYQMTLNADPDYLTFEKVEAGALNISEQNFGLTEANRGLISTLWYSSDALNIEQNTTLFTIYFRVNQGGKHLSDILQASSDKLSAEAYATGEMAKNIQLSFDKNGLVTGYELFQNQPNPFNSETTIGFSLPKATPATVRFFDFSGRMVHQVRGNYGKGVHKLVINRSDLFGSGVLYYELETEEFTARKKMIVLE
ncbi:MAG: cohesin domain-containing protein [Bacteroidota bacterium]